MSTDQTVAAARLDGRLIANRWLKKHESDYEVTQQNGQLIEDYLAANGLPFVEENLEKAFQALAAQGISFKSKPQVPAIQTLNEVAPIPPYFPKLETMADFHRLSPADNRRFATGPEREKYQARLKAVQQGYTNPKPLTPAESAVLDQYGLPTVPGIDAKDLPNNLAECRAMRDYALLYKSQKYGEAFRARVAAIIKKEGR